jgi:hypothetical protein
VEPEKMMEFSNSRQAHLNLGVLGLIVATLLFWAVIAALALKLL